MGEIKTRKASNDCKDVIDLHIRQENIFRVAESGKDSRILDIIDLLLLDYVKTRSAYILHGNNEKVILRYVNMFNTNFFEISYEEFHEFYPCVYYIQSYIISREEFDKRLNDLTHMALLERLPITDNNSDETIMMYRVTALYDEIILNR
jgi:hypothetical protein